MRQPGIKIQLICISGPTAVGKTDVALALAEHLQTEIISFDARQFYRELQIGAAPPTAEELSRVPHHFIGHLNVRQSWSAGEFAEAALRKIEALSSSYSQIVLVGGSGLYLKALLEGFAPMPDIPPTVRQDLNAKYRAEGITTLQKELAQRDPDYYARVDRQNPQRLIRALEVIEVSGQPYSYLRQFTPASRPFTALKIALELPRKQLHQRIDQRVDQMLADGLEDEARNLYPLRHCHALQTLGYREWWPFFEGHRDREETIRLIKRNSRRYAKRQLTWLRKEKDLHWFAPNQISDVLRLVEEQNPGRHA